MNYQMLITVDKYKLLRVLRGNREKHRTVFLAALEGYRTRMTEILEDTVKQLAAGKTPEIHLVYARPEDHTREYDRIIGMVEMDQGDDFVLDESTYAQYVNDDWTWRRQWAATTVSYANDVYIANYGAETE